MNIATYFKKIFIQRLLLVAMLLTAVGVIFAVSVEAAFNSEINYQGKLADASGSPVADGTYAIEFNLYTVSSGGSSIWTESRTGVNEIQVTDGLFSVMLGEISTLANVNFNQTLYLGVTVEADAEMSPRKKLGAVVAAFEADRLDGLDSTRFLRSDTSNATSTTNTALILTQNGTGDILNLYDGATEVFNVLDGGNVGIGTTSPYAKLSIRNGQDGIPSFALIHDGNNEEIAQFILGASSAGTDLAVVFDNRAAGNETYLQISNLTTGSNAWMFGVDDGTTSFALDYGAKGEISTPEFTVTSAGNVGIGTTTPGAKLSVGRGDAIIDGFVKSSYFTSTSTATSTFAGGFSLGQGFRLQNFNCSTNGNGGALTTDANGYVTCSNDDGGSGSPTGSEGQLQFYSGGSLGADSQLYWDNTTKRLGIGSTTPGYQLTVAATTSVGALVVGTPTSLPNAIVNVASSVDSYLQVAIQNKSSGTNASTDFVATNDIGNDSKYYIDLGINSSAYSNPSYTITGANDGYLYNSDGALAIGTASSTNTNAVLKFHTGGTLASNERMRIDASGNVGIGTTSVTERLQIEGGNILIGERADLVGSWAAQTNAIGTIQSGGTTGIGTTTSMAVYNGSLYVGTEKASGAEVYRYNGNGGWTKVSQAAGTIAEDGGATTAITSVSAMAVYNGMLYVGTTKTDAAEVYRYDGNSSWTKVSSTTAGAIGGFATTTAIDSVSAMAVHGGQLFIGTTESARAEVYRYDVSQISTAFMFKDGWTRVSTSNGAGQNPGNIGADTAVNAINTLYSYGGSLFAGTSKASAGAVYQYKGYTGTGSGFVRMNVAAGTFTGNGTTITTVTNVRKLAVYNGQLYAGIDGVASAVNTARVVRMDGVVATTTATWQVMSSTTAGTIPNATTTAQNIDRITAMAVYKDELYLGTLEGGLASVYKLADGTTWELVSSPSFGYIGSTASTTVSAIGAMQVYNDDLWVGTGDPDGAEIFKYNVVEGESYALKFQAAADDADAEQNGLKNTGSIMFVAEQSAWSVNGNTQTGKFVFSHGINTVTGAYDVAEDYPTRDDTLSPGDVVSIDPSERVMVKKSKGKNDQNIIGIYSSEPALRLSQVDTHIDGARAVPIALAGRVPVNVTLENGPINIGDYLVASNEPGKAAKAIRPGRVIGRALTPYAGTDAESKEVTVFIGVETITWNDIAEAEAVADEFAVSESETSPDSVLEFITSINDAISDIAYAFMNKADNLSLVIANKFTAIIAQVKELFVSELVIVPNGSITLPRGEHQIAGSGTIEAGDHEVFISNNTIDEFSLISITPTAAADAPLYVSEKKSKQGFVVRTEKAMNTSITFDWFSIKTYDYVEEQTVISEDEEEVESAESDTEETEGETELEVEENVEENEEEGVETVETSSGETETETEVEESVDDISVEPEEEQESNDEPQERETEAETEESADDNASSDSGDEGAESSE